MVNIKQVLLVVLVLVVIVFILLFSEGTSPSGIVDVKEDTLTLCHNLGTEEEKTIILPKSEAEEHIRQHGDKTGLCKTIILQAGEGATIEGEGGVTLTIEPGSLPYEAEVGIIAISPEDFTADPGDMVSVGAVEVVFNPIPFDSAFVPPKKPFKISITNPGTVSKDTTILVAQQMLADSLGDPRKKEPPSLKSQFIAKGIASVDPEMIRTVPMEIFPGIYGGGLFNFLVLETGFVTGNVTDATGPRPNVVTVSNDTNTIVSVTDAFGNYALPISGGCPCAFTVTGFDPFRGSSGSAAGNVPSDGAITVEGILLAPMATPAITREGIRNGGFERGNLTSWATNGNATVRQNLVSAATIINPTEGQWMADITTSDLAVGEIGSSLSQTFTVPRGVGTLRFDFNFVSEEFPEWVGSQYNDAFTAVITTPNGETTFAQTSVNSAQGVGLIGDCGFPGGDSTCGQTGWVEGSVDLSPWSGGAPINVDLVFGTTDAGDNIYDTHVLVDNLRFATVFIDAKFLQGPTLSTTANLLRVQTEVLGANEILSQAGLNVRIRNTRVAGVAAGTTDALVDTDVTWNVGAAACPGGVGVNGIPTAEENAILAIARSAVATDINAYYSRTLIGNAVAIAIGPDDFCNSINILANSGTIIEDVAGGCAAGGHVLAHELGHLLVSPQTAANVLEHGAAAGNFMGGNCAVPLLGTLTRNQSANLNRAGAPMLLP